MPSGVGAGGHIDQPIFTPHDPQTIANAVTDFSQAGSGANAAVAATSLAYTILKNIGERQYSIGVVNQQEGPNSLAQNKGRGDFEKYFEFTYYVVWITHTRAFGLKSEAARKNYHALDGNSDRTTELSKPFICTKLPFKLVWDGVVWDLDRADRMHAERLVEIQQKITEISQQMEQTEYRYAQSVEKLEKAIVLANERGDTKRVKRYKKDLQDKLDRYNTSMEQYKKLLQRAEDSYHASSAALDISGRKSSTVLAENLYMRNVRVIVDDDHPVKPQAPMLVAVDGRISVLGSEPSENQMGYVDVKLFWKEGIAGYSHVWESSVRIFADGTIGESGGKLAAYSAAWGGLEVRDVKQPAKVKQQRGDVTAQITAVKAVMADRVEKAYKRFAASEVAPRFQAGYPTLQGYKDAVGNETKPAKVEKRIDKKREEDRRLARRAAAQHAPHLTDAQRSTAVSKPTNLAVSWTDDKPPKVHLTWDQVENAAAYRVEFNGHEIAVVTDAYADLAAPVTDRITRWSVRAIDAEGLYSHRTLRELPKLVASQKVSQADSGGILIDSVPLDSFRRAESTDSIIVSEDSDVGRDASKELSATWPEGTTEWLSEVTDWLDRRPRNQPAYLPKLNEYERMLVDLYRRGGSDRALRILRDLHTRITTLKKRAEEIARAERRQNRGVQT